MLKFHFFLFLLISASSFAQPEKFPEGIYLNIVQLKNKTPIPDTSITVIKRSSGDIIWNGGNDYKLLSDSLKKSYLREDIFAYCKNDSLYINGYFFKLQYWYCLCLTKGNFLVFRSCMSSDAVVATAVLGGALAAGLTAKDRYLSVLSLRTGKVKDVTPEYVAKRLEENQELLNQYNAEPDKKSDDVLIKYLDLLNKFILPTSKPPVDSTKVNSKKKHK